MRRIAQRENLSKRAKRSLPHLFDFAYGENARMLISERPLPEFEDWEEKRIGAYDLDDHVEHGSLRDWTLPVSAVWDRWHHRNRYPGERFQHLPADNRSPLYGADEHIDS